MSNPRRWTREPLVHFLLIGALLFLLDGLFGAAPPADDTIVISEAQVGSIIERFRMQWQRPPTPDELRGLVDVEVREEVLYREALAMGLDRDDTIVRRRMVQKLEFLSQDLVDSDPSDETLREFFEANAERFAEPEQISFVQVYLNPDRRGDDIEADAAAMLAGLRTAPEQPLDELGDAVLLRSRYVAETRLSVASQFGSAFAEQVFTLEPGTWQGPVTSGFGIHLVRVEERIASRRPEFGAVRDRVRDEYLAEQRRLADERLYESLRGRYQVVYDLGNAAEVGEGER